MTLQEFKAKAENNEELKQALKEALEKGNEALAAFLKAQGVEISGPVSGRFELSDESLDDVVGGLSLKTIKYELKELFTLNDVEKQHYKDIYNGTKKFVEKVVHDTIYTS